MYQIIKRDGQIAEFDISKIANAMKKAFDATNTEYTDNVIDFLAIRVSADFLPKIKNGYVAVEDIQDSVEAVLAVWAARCKAAATMPLPKRISCTANSAKSSVI